MGGGVEGGGAWPTTTTTKVEFADLIYILFVSGGVCGPRYP